MATEQAVMGHCGVGSAHGRDTRGIERVDKGQARWRLQHATCQRCTHIRMTLNALNSRMEDWGKNALFVLRVFGSLCYGKAWFLSGMLWLLVNFN